jgi:hypothetical protein
MGTYIVLGWAFTTVEAVAALFEVSGSPDVPVTVAVLLTVPRLVGVTTIVIVALAPPARDPTLHVTVPFFGSFFLPVDRVHGPWVEDMDLKITLLGRGSVMVTPVASCGPLLVTVIVYVVGPLGTQLRLGWGPVHVR